MTDSDSFPSQLSTDEEDNGANPFGAQAQAPAPAPPAPPTPHRTYDDLKMAVLSEDLGAVDTCVSSGLSVDEVDHGAKAVLFFAIEKQKLASVKHLIDHHDAALDIRDMTMQEVTPLHTACQRGFADAISIIIQSGRANVNAQDKRGKTPLHLAAVYSPLGSIQRLVESGATVNVSDNNQYTPLHSATNASRSEVVQYFLDQGADVTLRNKSGLTPLEVARKRNALDCIALLEAKEATASHDDGVSPAQDHDEPSNPSPTPTTTTTTTTTTNADANANAARDEGSPSSAATPNPTPTTSAVEEPASEQPQPGSIDTESSKPSSAARPQSARAPTDTSSSGRARPQSAKQTTTPAPFQSANNTKSGGASGRNSTASSTSRPAPQRTGSSKDLNASQGSSSGHIARLEELRRQLKEAEDKQEYGRAEELHKKIIEEKENERKKRKRNLLVRQQSDVADHRKRKAGVISKFDNETAERRKALQAKHTESTKALHQRHQEEVKKYESQRQEALARSKPRPSAQVLQTRAMQSRYAQNKQYTLAEKCKKDAEQMLLDEEKEFKSKFHKATKARLVQIRRKYLADKKIMEDKHASELAKFDASARRERELLLKQHAASNLELQTKLGTERSKTQRNLNDPYNGTLGAAPPPPPRRTTSTASLQGTGKKQAIRKVSSQRSRSNKDLSRPQSSRKPLQESEDSGLPPGPEPEIEDDDGDDSSGGTAAQTGAGTTNATQPHGGGSPQVPQSDATEDAPIPSSGPRKSVLISDQAYVYDDGPLPSSSSDEDDDPLSGTRGAAPGSDPLPPPPPRMTDAEAAALLAHAEEQEKEALARRHPGVALLGHIHAPLDPQQAPPPATPAGQTGTGGDGDQVVSPNQQSISDSANAVLAVVNMLSSQIGNANGVDSSQVAQLILQQVQGLAPPSPSKGAGHKRPKSARTTRAPRPTTAGSQRRSKRDRPTTAAPMRRKNSLRPSTASRSSRPMTADPSRRRPSTSTTLAGTRRIGNGTTGTGVQQRGRSASKPRPDWCYDTRAEVGTGSSDNLWFQAGRLADPMPPSFRRLRPKSPYTRHVPALGPQYTPTSPRRAGPLGTRSEAHSNGGLPPSPSKTPAVQDREGRDAEEPLRVDRHQGSIAPSDNGGSEFWLALIDDQFLAKTERGEARPFKTHLQHLRDSVLLEETQRQSNAGPGARDPHPPQPQGVKKSRRGKGQGKGKGTGRGMRARRQQHRKENDEDPAPPGVEPVSAGAPFVNTTRPGPKGRAGKASSRTPTATATSSNTSNGNKAGMRGAKTGAQHGTGHRPVSPRRPYPPNAELEDSQRVGNRYSYRALYNAIVSQENHSDMHRNPDMLLNMSSPRGSTADVDTGVGVGHASPRGSGYTRRAVAQEKEDLAASLRPARRGRRAAILAAH